PSDLPVRAPIAVASAPHTARARAATVAPYPSSGIIGIGIRSDRLRGSVASSGAFAAQALHQLLVAGLRAVVGSLVLLRVLGEDERGLEVALPRPRAFDDRAAPFREEIRGGALVLHGDVGLAVREGEGEIEALGLPLERAGKHETAQAVRLARHGGGEKLARGDEVDHALAHPRPDEIRDGPHDDEPTDHDPPAPAHALLRVSWPARLLARPVRWRQ